MAGLLLGGLFASALPSIFNAGKKLIGSVLGDKGDSVLKVIGDKARAIGGEQIGNLVDTYGQQALGATTRYLSGGNGGGYGYGPGPSGYDPDGGRMEQYQPIRGPSMMAPRPNKRFQAESPF